MPRSGQGYYFLTAEPEFVSVGNFTVKPQGSQAVGETEAACLVVAVHQKGLVGFCAHYFQAELLFYLFHSEGVVEVAVGEKDVF